MVIAGLEKLTLLDYPGRLSAIIFTYGCNMVCSYCHNPELVVGKLNRKAIYSEDEVLKFLETRVGKLDAVTITGGEPTMHKDLPQFIKKVKELGFELKLDTNGSFPKIVAAIAETGLVDYWAMDVKYAEELYSQGLNGGQMITGINESIQTIMNCGAEYEFRTTYIRSLHNDESVEKIGQMVNGAKSYYIQNFRPGKTIDPSLTGKESFKPNELEHFAQIMRNYVDRVEIRA
ncbi:MAG: anaerobic ribonucleoside-triphosphate reductase activating protein [Candidatus Dojkabacteria bacterium]|nr:MAG: anaerobic ribonucleoside-triphosphate reductase activating protein [Candidatus Dojkabacteria bacterium]